MKPQDVYQEVNNLLFHELKSLGKVSTGNNQPWNGQEFTYWNWAKRMKIYELEEQKQEQESYNLLRNGREILGHYKEENESSAQD